MHHTRTFPLCHIDWRDISPLAWESLPEVCKEASVVKATAWFRRRDGSRADPKHRQRSKRQSELFSLTDLEVVVYFALEILKTNIDIFLS